MKSATAVLTLKLLGDNQSTKALKEASSSVDKFERGLDKASLAAGAALGGVAAAGFGAVKAAEAVASANAGLGQVLSNMGMDTATERALAYAKSLEKSLGVDEKVIKNTQTKLATFSELASSADQAGGAFDRATLAALDMAAAGFGTAEQNAVQLGKALQDPVAGVGALARAGVTFSDDQKQMIAALVETGDTAAAQNLILQEVERQVGGTATATADASEKMRLGFAEVGEQIGAALLPMFESLLPYVEALAGWLAENADTAILLGGIVATLAGAVLLVNGAYTVWNALAAVSNGLQKIQNSEKMKAAGAWALETAKLVAHTAATVAYNGLMAIVRGATIAWSAAQAALNIVMSLNPIMLVVIAVGALIAAVVLAYQKCDWFRNLVDKIWGFLKNAFQGALDAVAGAWDAISGAVERVIGWFKSAWDWIKKVAGAVKDFLGNINPFKGLFGGKSRSVLEVRGRGWAGGAGRDTAAPVIYTRAAGWNPQREAVALAQLLTGAKVRTGYRGLRPA